jgi:hypothetical protein
MKKQQIQAPQLNCKKYNFQSSVERDSEYLSENAAEQLCHVSR